VVLLGRKKGGGTLTDKETTEKKKEKKVGGGKSTSGLVNEPETLEIQNQNCAQKLSRKLEGRREIRTRTFFLT